LGCGVGVLRRFRVSRGFNCQILHIIQTMGKDYTSAIPTIRVMAITTPRIRQQYEDHQRAQAEAEAQEPAAAR
jgi:hypothetical protein